MSEAVIMRNSLFSTYGVMLSLMLFSFTPIDRYLAECFVPKFSFYNPIKEN